MTKISSQIRFGSATLAIAAGMTAWAAPAIAQQTPPAATTPSTNDEPIVITGSRIRRDPLDQDQQVVFVDRADIDRTGLTSTAEVLQRLPGSGGALNSRFNNSGNFGNPPDGGGVGAGAAEADLRYLSSRRVLVLVDGLRYVNGASASGVPGSIDLNSIPEAMIERIEVLQSSAAAIYGSDAIGGVINIISRRSQEGWIASAQLGSFGEGDGFTQNYALTWGTGTSEGGTRLVIGANYVKQDEVSSGDRSISLFPTPGTTACDNSCSSGTPLGRFIVLGNNLTLRHPVLTGRPVYNPLNPTDPASDYKAFTTADRFNFAPYNFIQVPLERYGGFVNFTQEIGERTHFLLRAVYNRRNSSNQAAPLPLFVGPDAGNGNRLDNITIDASNPFNPFGTLRSGRNPDGTSNGQIPNYNFIGRRVVENGPRRYDQSVDTYYAAATLDGGFEMAGHDWFWDVNGVWGRNRAKQEVHGNINAANLTTALGPVAACTAPCVPFNIFGGEGSITDAMLGYVAFTQRDSSRQKLWDFSANLTGSLFDLPGGPVGLAIGVEHRDLSGSFDPDPTVAAGNGSDIPALPTAGGYNVDEAYAELRLPLLRDTPFFHRLEFTGAARYSDYSTSGSTTTFSAGINWEPIENLLFRGSWAEGFRAPSIGELFGTPSRFDQEVEDPCSGMTGATPANIRANCIADGVPANNSYVQLNAQLPVVTGGNDQLLPENSESWGFGMVWRPSFAPRLSLEANYYNITVDGAIAAIDAETLLGRCATAGDALSCAAIDRSASGQVTQIRGFLQNIGSIETDGIDLSLIYRGGQGSAGTFNLIWNASFLLNYRVTVPATTGFTTIDREGTEQGSPDQVFAKFKSTGIIDWTLGEIGASVTGRYISGVDESNGNRLDARFYTDLQLRWAPGWMNDGLTFAIGANNLFDVDPPACFTCGLNNMDPTTYDVPGTFFYGRVTFRMR
ncbi:MAG: iron complex outerrane recepter protein [Sphingomonadales bacterium]|jgi:iron complex outermembrane receptor protein|nr:iron complex outerrane recepter protein [Sphingomonadales bacterium]